VLLGDRDWIEQAFAEVNKEMKAIDVGAEHSFGGRFVEKAIQLSMVLPAMTGEVREGYVEFLLTGKHRMADPAAEPEMLASIAPEFDLDSVLKNARVIASPVDQGSVDEIDKQVRDALSKTSFKDRESAAQQVFASLKTADSLKQGGISDQIRRSFGRELDFLAVGDEAAEAETRHLLLALAPALPPNPRQIKRILNTLTLNQQVMTKIYPEYRAGSTEWQQLARWVVMAVEWPMSWFTLTRHPELADVVLAMSANPLDEENSEKGACRGRWRPFPAPGGSPRQQAGRHKARGRAAEICGPGQGLASCPAYHRCNKVACGNHAGHKRPHAGSCRKDRSQKACEGTARKSGKRLSVPSIFFHGVLPPGTIFPARHASIDPASSHRVSTR
jgi:hypothetical protein